MAILLSEADHPIAQLYRDHGSWLVGWLHRQLGDGWDAADLSHDVFTRLLARPRPMPLARPRAYLSTIARGLVIDHWRRRDLQRAWTDSLSSIPPEHAPSAETIAVLFETLVLIDRALDELKPAIRAAFLLVQFDGLTCAQAALELGVSQPTAERHVARAVRHCYALWFAH